MKLKYSVCSIKAVWPKICKRVSLFFFSFFTSLSKKFDDTVQINCPQTADGRCYSWLTSTVHFNFLLDKGRVAENLKTRAPRGTDRSPEYNEHFCYKLDSRVKKLTTEWNQKQQHFIKHASRSLLWIRFFAVAFRSEEVFLKNGTPPPGDLFCLALDQPLGKYGQSIFMHVPGHEHFIPTKFRKHPLSCSVVKAGYVFPYINMH